MSHDFTNCYCEDCIIQDIKNGHRHKLNRVFAARAELVAEVERLRALVGLCRPHYATPMDPAENCDTCAICLLNRISRLRAYLPLARAAAAWSAAFVDTDDPYSSEMAVHIAHDALSPEQRRALMEDK